MKALLTTIILCSSLLAQTPASKSAASKGTASKTGTPAAKPSLLNPASLHAKAPEVFKAQFTTTKGDFVVEVHREWAPLGADRFYNLVKNGFFNNTAFFRVVPGFMVQFGLGANPAVNKVWEHANIKDDPVMGSNTRNGDIRYCWAEYSHHAIVHQLRQQRWSGQAGLRSVRHSDGRNGRGRQNLQRLWRAPGAGQNHQRG